MSEKKCVYCGKPCPKEPFKAEGYTRNFAVCSADCKEKTETYLKNDKKFKLPMYLMVFIGGIAFMISAFLGDQTMIYAYSGQILAGIAFIIFPYPVSSFEAFFRMPIKQVTILIRLIGIFLTVFGIYLLYTIFI